jgi:hypothetical protein
MPLLHPFPHLVLAFLPLALRNFPLNECVGLNKPTRLIQHAAPVRPNMR